MASPPNLKSNVVDMNLDLPSELLLLANNAIRKSPPPLHSSCFEVRFTPYTGGLGAFASTTIPTGTQVFMAEEPFVSVVYAPFKKEVCAYCFAYDRGRKMKQVERSTVAKDSRGIAWFCTTECHRQWRDRYGDLGTAAISRVTAALSKTQKSGSEQCTSDRLTTNDIEVAWNQADKARSSKAAPVLFQDDDQDTLYFLLDGIISRAVRPDAWDTFLSLIPSLQPYSDTSTLQSHIRMLHFLRHHVPPALQSFCTAETFLALITRDHGNSFGIFEDELGRDGEMLGYGSWTDASYFNHSCIPNLAKKQSGRAYVFTAKRDIEAGEELSICYIEDALNAPVVERDRRLMAGWGFVCSCSRCKEERLDSGDRLDETSAVP